MGPQNQYTAAQDVVAFAGYVIGLFKEALPDPADRTLFDRLMFQARAKGMSWIQGLEYVVEQRRTALC